jgi:hypothetical protein
MLIKIKKSISRGSYSIREQLSSCSFILLFNLRVGKYIAFNKTVAHIVCGFCVITLNTCPSTIDRPQTCKNLSKRKRHNIVILFTGFLTHIKFSHSVIHNKFKYKF